jgi:hypothetical protein
MISNNVATPLPATLVRRGAPACFVVRDRNGRPRTAQQAAQNENENVWLVPTPKNIFAF